MNSVRILLFSGVSAFLLFGLTLWSSASKYNQFGETLSEKSITEKLAKVFRDAQTISAHGLLAELTSENSRNNTAEIEKILSDILPDSEKASIYLWSKDQLNYWDLGDYEMYFETPPVKDTVQILSKDRQLYFKFTVTAPPADLSVQYILPYEILKTQKGPVAEQAKKAPLPPPAAISEVLAQRHHLARDQFTSNAFFAGYLVLLVFIFLLTYQKVNDTNRLMTFMLLTGLLFFLRGVAVFYPLENPGLGILFQPEFLGYGIPGSLADVLINIAIVFLYSLFIYRFALPIPAGLSKKNRLLAAGLGYFIFSVLSIGFSLFVRALIWNQYIPLDIDVVKHLSSFSVVVLLATLLLLLALFIISIKIFILLQQFNLPWTQKIAIFFLAVFVSAVIPLIIGWDIHLWLWIISITIIMLLFDLFLDSPMRDFTWISVWILILSLFYTVLFYHFYKFKHTEDSLEALRQSIQYPDTEIIDFVNTIYDGQGSPGSEENLKTALNDKIFSHPEIQNAYTFSFDHATGGLQWKDTLHLAYAYRTDWPGTYYFRSSSQSRGAVLSARAVNDVISLRSGDRSSRQQILFGTGDWTHYYKRKNLNDESLFFPSDLDSLVPGGSPFLQMQRDNTIYSMVHAGEYTAVGRQQFDGLLQPLSFFSFSFIAALILLAALLGINQVLPFLPPELQQYMIRNLTLSNKIQFSMLAILIAAFTIVGIVSANFYKRSYKETLELSVKEYYQRIKRENRMAATTSETLQGLPGKFIIYNEYGRKVHPESSMETNRLPYPIVRMVRTSSSLDNFNEIIPGSLIVPISMNQESPVFLTYPHVTEVPEGFYRFLNLLLNAFVFLLLISSAVSFSISHSIISPLAELGRKLKDFSLGKRNEPISWKPSDELGTLIQAYNEMITKLEQSAELLAHSEREVAWREMAKQVAHEIKNPLTPMKLSIQHMDARINDADEETAKEIVHEVSKILIEQIDNLSRIASEFSSFAKLPKPEYERISLNDLMTSVYDLFSTRSRIRFNLYVPIDELFVQADRTHLIRVMNNLLKNAIQSIPGDKEGHIVIRLRDHNGNAIVMVEDNGKGIERELKDKVFFPNFTTKSSGTGLGLAISKNIIETFGGTIYFRHNRPRGTVFIFELPLIEEV